MTTSTRKNFLLCLALLGVSAVTVSAQSDTVPAGYFTVNIAAGISGTPSLSVVSFPLQQSADSTVGGVTTGPAGQMVGQVTGITSNTITNSNAGWTAGQLSVAASPYLIQFTSGAAAGRTFLLSTTTANTSTTLTLDSSETTDLTTLGIVTSGTNPPPDTYQIVVADTLSSIFGTPASTGVLGGTTASAADNILLLSTAGTWVTYYYDTNTSGAPPTTIGWARVGSNKPSANVVVRPDTGVIYERVGTTALSLMLMGNAPSVQRQATVSSSGATLLANNWPVDIGLGKTATETITINGTPTVVTLNPSNIEKVPGWVASGSTTSAGAADTVQVFTGTAWVTYYYDGNDWRRVGSNKLSDNLIIPAGTAIVLGKTTPTTGQQTLAEALPYSL